MTRPSKWAAALAIALLMPLGVLAARAQDSSRPQDTGRPQGADSPRPGRGQFAGMQRVYGTVTAISGPQMTLKAEDGAVYQVVTTDNTRLMRGRGEAIKLADVKPGDGLMAVGNLDTPSKTLHAAIVLSVDADQRKHMEEARKQQLANLGKTSILGTVKAIDLDNATMTVDRPDGVTQTIGFDEGTSFRRGRMRMMGGGDQGIDAAAGSATPTGESITLADVKVGDRIAGPGELKGGRFIAKELMVMTPGGGRRPPEGSPAPASAPGAANSTPAATPQSAPRQP